MKTHITERKTTERDAWARLKVPVRQDIQASQLGATPVDAPAYEERFMYPDVIDVTASDYDEGGNNSVTISVPCRRGAGGPAGALELGKNIQWALDEAEKTLYTFLQQQRKKETAGDKIIRFLRREWRYLLSRAKV